MAVRKSKRGAPAAHAPAAAEPSPSSPSAAGKRMRLQDCSETVSKEERFIVRLSEVLRVQGGGEVAALRTVRLLLTLCTEPPRSIREGNARMRRRVT